MYLEERIHSLIMKVQASPLTVTLIYINKWFGKCQDCHCNRGCHCNRCHCKRGGLYQLISKAKNLLFCLEIGLHEYEDSWNSELTLATPA